MDNIPVTAGIGTTVGTHDMGAEGGTGHAQKMQPLASRSIATGHAFAVTISTSVIKPTSGLTVPANTTHMLISIEAGDVRYMDDGTAPTVANGVLLTAGTLIELPVPATPADLQFIRSNTLSVDAVMNVSYRKYI